MYMKKCVEAGPVVSLQDQWLSSILSKIPDGLKVSPYQKELIESTFHEIRKDFNGSMKKSMGKRRRHCSSHWYLYEWFRLKTQFFVRFVSSHTYYVIKKHHQILLPSYMKQKDKMDGLSNGMFRKIYKMPIFFFSSTSLIKASCQRIRSWGRWPTSTRAKVWKLIELINALKSCFIFLSE